MKILSTLACIALATPALAETAPYAGQDRRAVSSFSEADQEALLSGDGWGLAKPAELNGWPGPRHILDLAEDLDLTSEQETAVQAIFDAMNAKARTLGETLIEAEAALDAAFESGDIDTESLDSLLAEAERVRADLRAVHLAAHLEATPVLTRHQRMTYAKLRGYDTGGGHDGHGDH